MQLEILKDVEYATALKDAIVMRRNGTITRPVDDQLGLFAYNITQWAIAEAILDGQLWRTHAHDEDFVSAVLLYVVRCFDKVNLEREPKEIAVYLKRCGRSAIRDQIASMNALKRAHEEIPLEGAIVATDIYGHRTGTAYEIEKQEV
jgi:hypothetical protein